MKIADRLDNLEERLTPKELVTLWMQEAHEHGDLISYGNWLLDQPEDVYPLVRLPAIIYKASPASRARASDQDREALRASYRDLLFLYHLHSQVNERVTRLRPELIWRALWAAEWARNARRKSEAAAGAGSRKEKPPEEGGKHATLEEDLARWRGELDRLCEDLHVLLGAARLLSRRYFSGEVIVYPDELRTLRDLVELTEVLRDIDFFNFTIPAERKRMLAELTKAEEEDEEEDMTCQTSPAARALARELVVLARAETLAQLGEPNRGVGLVAEWLRKEGA